MRLTRAIVALSLLALPLLSSLVRADEAKEEQLYPYCAPRPNDRYSREELDFALEHIGLAMNDCGFIDKTGHYVIEPNFWDVRAFSGGVAAVLDKNGKVGVIRSDGSYVMQPHLDLPKMGRLPEFANGLAVWADESGRSGVINLKGDWVLRPQADFVDLMADGFIVTGHKIGDRPSFAVFDSSGHPVLLDGVQDIEGPAGGHFLVKLNGKYGITDLKGAWVVRPSLEFKSAGVFSEGLAAVETDKGWGYIDTEGKFVIPPKFGDASEFHDGMAMANEPRVYFNRFIDHTGAYANNLTFSQGATYKDGIAAVSPLVDANDPFKNGPWIYVDKAGKRLFDWTAYYALNFENGFAVVSPEENSAGVIDKTGQWRLKPMAGINTLSIHILPGPVIQVEPIKSGEPTWLYFDTDGKPILPH